MDYRNTSVSALMPTSLLEPTELTDYCEWLVLSLSMVRELVASKVWKAFKQGIYKKFNGKKCHDKKAKLST